MSKNQVVIISFGDSKGNVSKKILQEKYHIIERLSVKVEMAQPKLKMKTLPDAELGIFSNIISKKRNQSLLNSFLRFNNEDDLNELFEIKNQARTKLKNIDEELKTLSIFSEDFKIIKFTKETKASEREASNYMLEFNYNVQLAIQSYKKREQIVKSFADKNKMNIVQARAILQANRYNAAIFD